MRDKPILRMALALLLALALLAAAAGCGREDGETTEDVAARFLDACNSGDAATVLALLSPGYRADSGIPETLTGEQLGAALDGRTGFALTPDQQPQPYQGKFIAIVSAQDGQAETLVLEPAESGWLVANFTAFDWTAIGSDLPDEAARGAAVTRLRDFLNACLDANTRYIFEALSAAFKDEHELEELWTASQFSGIFGAARSFEFDQALLTFDSETRGTIPVSIEFGSRGNLETESGDVVLVFENGLWRVDHFPFFIF
ncbi:MAG: hypothetical protein ACYC55_07320 [Candidatus Geothermincolia bacterium]